MKWKLYLPLFTVAVMMLLVAFMSSPTRKSDFDTAREMIVLRKVAHEVLRSAGDSSSRAPDIKRISATAFQIPFETAFSFKPDSLVTIIENAFAHYKLSAHYIVNVKEQATGEVVFGYAMLGNEQDNIMPCLGRDQVATRYTIDIKLEEAGSPVAKPIGWGALVLAALGGFWVFGRRKKNIVEAEPPSATTDKDASTEAGKVIGLFRFFPEHQFLYWNGTKTELTAKETRLLEIFSDNLNQVVERKQLQKEVWEDEGVIVGRSLDMFISRLRKKLEGDPTLKLVNIHGKGYKLEYLQS